MVSTVKALGRALGKARDQDEALRLVGDIEERSPSTAPAAAVLRARLLPERVRQRRRLIKALEAADVEGLEQLRKAVHHEASRSGRHLWGRRGSQSGLAAVIAEGAEILEQRMDHASGVDFPDRAHKVRVAIKKLRYAVEFLDGHEKIRKPSVRVLRRAQEALGQVHDREVLRQRLTSLAKDEDIPAARELERVLEAETRAIFETYRAMRPALLAVCTDLAAWSRPGVARYVPVSCWSARWRCRPPPFCWPVARAAPADERPRGPVRAIYPRSSSCTRRPVVRAARVSNPPPACGESPIRR